MRISDWSSDVCSSDLILTALGGFAELARERPNDDPDLAASLDQVVLGAQRATLVVRRLLGPELPAAPFVRPEGGDATAPVLVVDDEETVRDYAAPALVEHGSAVPRARGAPGALERSQSTPGR